MRLSIRGKKNEEKTITNEELNALKSLLNYKKEEDPILQGYNNPKHALIKSKKYPSRIISKNIKQNEGWLTKESIEINKPYPPQKRWDILDKSLNQEKKILEVKKFKYKRKDKGTKISTEKVYRIRRNKETFLELYELSYTGDDEEFNLLFENSDYFKEMLENQEIKREAKEYAELLSGKLATLWNHKIMLESHNGFFVYLKNKKPIVRLFNKLQKTFSGKYFEYDKKKGLQESSLQIFLGSKLVMWEFITLSFILVDLIQNTTDGTYDQETDSIIRKKLSRIGDAYGPLQIQLKKWEGIVPREKTAGAGRNIPTVQCHPINYPYFGQFKGIDLKSYYRRDFYGTI